jgi:serralysin
MNYGWLTPESDDDEVHRVVAHEVGHALGLIHEHQNPKGGIKWNEPAVIADLSGPPNEWDEEAIRHNVLDHYDPKEVTATDVDSASIMMYPIPAAWTLDGFSAGLNREISPLDTELIHGIYP